MEKNQITLSKPSFLDFFGRYFDKLDQHQKNTLLATHKQPDFSDLQFSFKVISYSYLILQTEIISIRSLKMVNKFGFRFWVLISATYQLKYRQTGQKTQEKNGSENAKLSAFLSFWSVLDLIFEN